MKSKRLLSCLALASALFTLTCPAANRTWTGSSGIDLNWMTPGNWQGSVAPSSGDSLIFPGVISGGSETNNNNFPDGTVFGSITITTARGQDYALGGNAVVLTGGIAEGSTGFGAGGAFVFFNITVSGNQTFTATGGLTFNDTINTAGNNLILNNSGSVVFNGTLSNSTLEVNGFSLAKTNTGTMTISSNATISATFYDFDVVVGEGTMVVDGKANGFTIFYIGQASLIVDGSIGEAQPQGSGGSISGSGYIGNIFQYSGGSATVTPGDNGAPGIMQCFFFEDDPLDSQGPDTLQFIINGTTPGTGYSQLWVDDIYTFGPSSLVSGTGASTALALQGNYTPQVGDGFFIVLDFDQIPYSVTNQGFFAGLPPDSILDMTNGASLGISYTSNFVELSTLRSTNSSFALWKGSVAADLSAYQSRNWSSTNNWAQGVGPASGDTLIFSPYQMSCYTTNGTLIPVPPITNDLPATTTLAGLDFTSSDAEDFTGINSYAVYGNPLTITAGITNDFFAGTNACYLDIATVGPLSLNVEFGGSLLLGGVIAGNSSIDKTGLGTLIYAGTTMDAFFGFIFVDQGTLEVDGSFTDGSFYVFGGMLDGTGTVSSVTVNAGTLKPGDGPGILQVDGDLLMAPGTTFEAELDNPIPGSGYDQLRVSGNINLNGATLNLQPNFPVDVGAAFLILVNQGTGPITGTFAGLPEGAIFQAAGQYFTISYHAGSEIKNVVVTRVNPPPNFTGITSLPPTAVQLQGTGATNTTYTIFANTNLATSSWVNIGTSSSDNTGAFLFDDSNVLTFPQRFYQVH